MDSDFTKAGKPISDIPVRISYRIIELFSDGLYSSPNKAIEELVSNSYDAGAQHVHIVLSPDPSGVEALIIVVDDGEGMDEIALKQHWLIGVSNKRDYQKAPHGRNQIGKFGIGKLATLVLAKKLTHLCKKNGKFYGVTMNYEEIPEGKDGSMELETAGVVLPLRELSEKEMIGIVPKLLKGGKPGYKAIELFGPNASPSWTIAIMSDLKEMAQNIQNGRLTWVLSNAMPIRSDFHLFLNGNPITPTKLDQKPLMKWILGKDIISLSEPAPDNLTLLKETTKGSEKKWGFKHHELGKITGFAEVFEHPISEGIDRNHGFFVYVYDRLLNIQDSHFGISANQLRHGTFSRFRMIVHIDGLDKELRSSRETVLETELKKTAQNILHAVFNVARNWLNEHDQEQVPGFKALARIRQSPGSLTWRPILSLTRMAIEGICNPRSLIYPTRLAEQEIVSLLNDLEGRMKSDEGLVVKIEHQYLSPHDSIAKLDVGSGILYINLLHPFVAAYPDDFEKDDTLSLLCMAEILYEAYLYETGVDEAQIIELVTRHDELLRQFARYKKRNARMIAQDLEDAATDQDQLEIELVAAFESLGFDATHIGGKGKPDGLAIAYLGARNSESQKYSTILEAKSKQELGKRVSAKSVDISRIAAHREDYACSHAVIVGPDFSTTQGETAALVKDARTNIAETGKTITFMKIRDLARLVRLRAVKHIGLDQIRSLFKCVSPEESSKWVDTLEGMEYSQPRYREILETIWELQKEVPSEAVEFSAVTTSLRIKKGIVLSKTDLIDLCKTLALIVPPEVVMTEFSVELTQRPDIVIEEARKILKQFPEKDQEYLKL